VTPCASYMASTNAIEAFKLQSPDFSSGGPIPTEYIQIWMVRYSIEEAAMKYQSGEEVRKGDNVLFHGEPGEIEFIVDALIGDPPMDWYMKEYGSGAMVAEPKAGRTFIGDTEDAED
jgi:hypothetical protein